MTNLTSERPLVIALYLPQFHPIPENDLWWGKGFTEWTNVARARPLFRGHQQPNVPADLGFYDLRVPETRQAQADLARRYGIGAFCYYHYWFAGRRLLERPFNEVLASKEPDFPFCLCWANETWTGIWHGAPDRVLIEQTYPGPEDFIAHFHSLLPAFHDKRYLALDGKPVFVVYKPLDLPSANHFADLWRKLARANGLPGLHLVGAALKKNWNPLSCGFDAVLPQPGFRRLDKNRKKQPLQPTIYRYGEVVRHIADTGPSEHVWYPCVVPIWDNTPRSGIDGVVLHGSTPALFREHFRRALESVRGRPPESRIVFVKSWNEWGEGNYLEPDLRFGHGYLEATKAELDAY